MEEKADIKSKIALILFVLFALLLILAKFLWAFTLWYEWVALSAAAIVYFVFKVVAPKSKQEAKSNGKNGHTT